MNPDVLMILTLQTLAYEYRERLRGNRLKSHKWQALDELEVLLCDRLLFLAEYNEQLVESWNSIFSNLGVVGIDKMKSHELDSSIEQLMEKLAFSDRWNWN